MAQGNVFKRMWNYVRTSLGMKFDEAADPRVQLEQAIHEAREQHDRLKEQAVTVIANRNQTEARLERAMEELESLNANAQQALLMADEARRDGRDPEAAEFERAAETLATQLVTVEKQIDSLKQLHLDAVTVADRAKDAVAQNSAALEKRLAEKQHLLSQLDQAKLAEQMNSAMQAMSADLGVESPTFDEVRDKIEARLAKAHGRTELDDATVDVRLLEVEQAQRNVDARRRLSELRSQLGISGPAAESQTASPSAETAAPEGEESGSDDDAVEQPGG